MDNVSFFHTTGTNNFLPIETVENFIFINPFLSLKNKILEFCALKNNWDGYGAIPLLTDIKEKSINFLLLLNSTCLDYVSDIFPNPNGTITFEWENKFEDKISLEIGEKNYSYFIKYHDKQPKLIDGEDIISDIDVFVEAVSELFGEEAFTLFF